MALWIEVSVRCDRTQENGMVKKVTEKYLIDAFTITEAEARTIEEISAFISGEFSIKKAVKTKIGEVFNMTADKFYLVKVGMITLDDKGVEKRSITQILVGAGDFDSALQTFKKGMQGTMQDYEIVSVSESQIIEVFPAKLA